MSGEEAGAAEDASSAATPSRPDFEHESLEEILFDIVKKLEDAERKTLEDGDHKMGGEDHPSE